MSVGIIVAVISAIASFIAVWVSLKTASDQRHLARQLAEEEHKLLFEQVRTERDSDIIRWTGECVSVLSELESEVAFLHLSPDNNPRQAGMRGLCHKLSALIDHGRMFFPNQAPEKKGSNRPPAYQGYRQFILTVLVRAYDVVMKFDPEGGDQERNKVRKSLVDLRRLFVSEAQLAIDPRRYLALKEMNDVKMGLGLNVQDLSDVEQI